jgi:hypothetical protein
LSRRDERTVTSAESRTRFSRVAPEVSIGIRLVEKIAADLRIRDCPRLNRVQSKILVFE